MLRESIFIFEPSSLGDGEYTAKIFFQVQRISGYVNIGDYIKDSDDNEYAIITFDPPMTQGKEVLLRFITNDVLPVVDSGYNSSIYTPNQINVRPYLHVAGIISSVNIYSAQNYEYIITTGWFSGTSSAEVGHRIVDISGKEFVLTYIDPVNRFNAPCRVQEIEREAIEPSVGGATLYSSTSNYSYFQGTVLNNVARNTIKNRDIFTLDRQIKNLEDSIISGGSGINSSSSFYNNTGSLITKLTPVRSNLNTIDLIDVSNESHIKSIVGIVEEDIENDNSGKIIFSGLLEDVMISGDVDNELWISKDGTITTTIPEVGIENFEEGDYVIRIGSILQNKEDPLKKDILINIDIRGQL